MKEQNDGKQITEDVCKLSKARREEIESLEIFSNLTNHIEDLRMLSNDSMVHEDACEYTQIPF